jgi:hypothetical protein
MAFLSSKLADKGIGISDKAKQQGQVAPLALRHVIDVDRTSLQKNRAQEVRAWEATLASADAHCHELGASERLTAAGYLDGVRALDGRSRSLGPLTEVLRRKQVDLDRAFDESVSNTHVARFLEDEVVVRENLRDAPDGVRPSARIGQYVGVEARSKDAPPGLGSVEFDHACADQRPVRRALRQV